MSKYERGERRLDVIEFLDISSALKMDASDVVDALKEAGKSVKAKGGRDEYSGGAAGWEKSSV